MRKSGFSELQIVQILAEYDAGAASEELAVAAFTRTLSVCGDRKTMG